MSADEQMTFGAWLRREMESRGYETDGPRSGGKTRLANEAGVAASTISRILSEDRIPEPKVLRQLAQPLGYTFGDMLVAAGLATPDELRSTVDDPDAQATRADTARTSRPPEDLWLGLEWSGLNPTERMIWHLPDTKPDTRLRIMELYRFLEKHVPARVDEIMRGERPEWQDAPGANGA